MSARVISILVLSICLFACEPQIDVHNTAPQITAVGPVSQGSDGVVSITVWLRDQEEQPVDLTVTLTQGGSESELNELGGHGMVGLTTSQEGTGRPHELLSTPNAVPVDGLIKLTVRALDADGLAAPDFVTQEFALQDGLPSP